MRNRADIQQRDVFISWTGSDVELKKKIADYLKTQGLNPLLSDEECQGDFEEWSRSASTSAHIFMPIITKNSLKSEGMKWELEEIDKKLCSPEKGFWKNAIVPVSESLEVYGEYKSMLSQEAQKEIRLISTALLGDTQNPLSEQVLQTIAELVKNRIASHFFGLYRAKAKPNFIKLIPLNASVQDLKDQSLKIEDLYVFRRIIEKVESQPDVVHETPEKLLKTGNVSFICGPAGSGKTQYVNQIFNQAKEKLVIQLSCPKVSVSEKNLLEFTFSEFYRICGERKYYTVEHFKSLLEARELVLVLDGLDEVVTKNATRKLIEKVEEYFKVYKNSTSVIFTGRNIKDGNLIVFGEVSATTYLLEKLTEEQIKSLGQNLFLLFGNAEKGEKFYVRVQDLNEEIRSNPLLLSQLAIVYNVSGEIPETIVGILEAVAEITFKTDSEMHGDISAIPSRFEEMISYHISDILKDFSRELYIKDPEKDGFEGTSSGLSFKKIMQHVLGVRYQEGGNAVELRTEFLLGYLQKRAIFCDGEFYHKMFLEYFTALSFWEECFDDYEGEIVDNRPIATLFANYSNEYWREVIKLFLIKADSVLVEKQTRNFYGIIFNQSKILDYTLLLETSKDLIVNKQSAYKAIITDILTKSVSGEYPAYGPLFWYVPEYNLYSELLLIANEFLGNAKALALIRDVCFICGNIYNASEFLLEQECENLFSSISESVQGVRKGLLELFFTGETSFVGGDNVYPRCFNVNEARAFMHMGHGLFARMNTPFEDELGLFSHNQVNELNGEYIGFISMPYNKEENERILNEKSCLKVCAVAFAQTENQTFEYVAFTRISVKVIYLPENITNATEDCLLHLNLSLNPLVFTCNNVYIGYLPKTVKKVKLREGITYIGSHRINSFANMKKLTEIDLPKTLVDIGDFAFKNCSSLKSIKLPDSVTKIGDGAFWGCSSLTSIEISNSVKEINSSAFWGCSFLTSIEIPNSVKEIGMYAFNGCSSLTSIKIPNSVKKIGLLAFFGCDSLTSIEISNSVTKIEEGAFFMCEKLTDVSFFANPTAFHPIIFEGCKNLKRIYVDSTFEDGKDEWLPFLQVCDEVVSIKNQKVLRLEKEENICDEVLRIPEGVKVIGIRYSNQKALKKLFIPSSVEEIKEYAFFGCENLQEIHFSLGLKHIGAVAFGSCKSLVSVNIPALVKEIGDAPFLKCFSLKEIAVDKDNKNYSSLNGDLYNKDQTTLVSYAMGKEDEMFIIPKTVKSIKPRAFSGCSSLTSIEIPNSVTEIGIEAFEGCSSLTSIKIPNSVKVINSSAFSGCSSLTSIEIPNSVTEMGIRTFEGCSSLTSIKIPNSVTEIRNSVFGNCSSLTSIEIPNSVKVINSSAFKNCSSLTSIEIPNSVTEIGWWAFEGCSLLTSIEIPNSVTEIGGYAFKDCSSLQEVVLPNSVRKIGKGAFAGCTGLKRVVISINFKNIITGIFGNIDKSIITYV